MKHLLIFTLLYLVFFGTSAQARSGQNRGWKEPRRYSVDINNYRGRIYTWMELNIKDLLRSHYSVRLSKAELVWVEIDAESMHGRVSLDLVVGNTVADTGNIRRNRNGHHTSNFLTLYNRNRVKGKQWLLDIRGSLHIRNIVVYLRENHKNDHKRSKYPGNRIVLGEQKIAKDIVFIFSPNGDKPTYTFHANGSWGHGIRIFCTKKRVRVDGVKVRTGDGREYPLYGLDRTYGEGESAEVFFPMEKVKSVVIEANSPFLRGSRGILGVELYSQ